MCFFKRMIRISFAERMKKLLVIVLLLVYGVSSSGMTLHLHYCCGKLDQIDLSPVKHTCGGENKPGKKSCCDNKELNFNLKADQTPVKLLVPTFHSFAVKPTPVEFHLSGPAQTKGLQLQIFAPPPLRRDFNTLFCIYRI
jgi:hypothetical protein